MSKEKDVLVKLADGINKRAKTKFKSNVEFANVCDVNESTIRRILQGKQNISVKVLKRICEALDVKMSDLLKETGN
ncbi:MAG TPA: helix-turn-helix transcriptional regulator [Bacteroidia bacterium]|nr:helix-turn-helix transcriptional regulator [Bacteroidia bacterium]